MVEPPADDYHEALKRLESEGHSPELAAHFRKNREQHEARSKKGRTMARARQTLKEHPHLFQPPHLAE
jgi:hypothetical protein